MSTWPAKPGQVFSTGVVAGDGVLYWGVARGSTLETPFAKVLANQHFGRPAQADCVTESRGPCWFVAPPLQAAQEREKQGVYVVNPAQAVTAPASLPTAAACTS